MGAPVSVLIPCFNCSATLERAISSVYHQTMRPAEVILVNDASTDSSRQLAEALQKTYEEGWLRVVSLETNCGPGTARNVSWEQAKQPYVAFLDADDAWHPRKVELQYSWMCEHPAVVLSGHPCPQLSPKSSLPALPEDWRARQVTPFQMLVSNCFPTRSAMLQRDIPYRFESGKRYCEDYQLFLEIVLAGLPAWRLELPLGYIYKSPYGGGGLSQRLWNMERGELGAYRYVRQQGKLNRLPYYLASSLSLAKYVNRSIRHYCSRLWKRNGASDLRQG